MDNAPSWVCYWKEITYCKLWHTWVNWSCHDQANGILSGLSQDGCHLLSSHSPESNISHCQKMIAIPKGSVLDRERKWETYDDGDTIQIYFFCQVATFIRICWSLFFGFRPFNWKIFLRYINWSVWSPNTKTTKTFMNVVIRRKKYI